MKELHSVEISYASENGNPKSFSPKNRKYALKKFFVSYDVFVIFNSVEEVSCKVKIKHNIINN